jgi:hypothetical protein
MEVVNPKKNSVNNFARFKSHWQEEKQEKENFDLEKIVAELLLEREEWEEYRLFRTISMIGLAISTLLVILELVNV